MKITLDASDFAQLADFWKRAPDITRTRLMQAMTWADTTVQSALREDLPKGAGGAAGLQGSIATEEHALADNVIGMVYSPLAHAAYVEFGTRPHPVSMSGIQSIADWVQAKFNEGNEKTARGIAFAIANKIRAKGTKANPVWQKTWDAKLPKIRERFDKAMRFIAQDLVRRGA